MTLAVAGLDPRIFLPFLQFYDKMNDLCILHLRYLRIIDLIYRESILRIYLPRLRMHDISSPHNIIEESMQDQYLLHPQVWLPLLPHQAYSFAIGLPRNHGPQKINSPHATREKRRKYHNDITTPEIMIIKSPHHHQRESLLRYTVTAFHRNDRRDHQEIMVDNVLKQ